MVRLLTGTLLGVALSAAAADVPERHNVLFQLDLTLTQADTPLKSWVEGGVGKLRYDEQTRALTTPRAFVEYRGVLTPTLTANAIMDFVDDAGGGVDVTEAYLLWRPVPRSATRSQLKLGAFYPPVSLENTDPGWASPYSFSFSAINTWIGEEIRVFGAEWSLRRDLGPAGSPHSIKLLASAFVGNDPAGTLVAIKGWSTHDRQTRLFDGLPLPSGATLEPFRELDSDPGFYVGAAWQYGQRLQVSALHYDNRADPYAFGSGQWGWDTRFNHVGIKLAGPWRLGLIGQHLTGDTLWILGVTPTGEIVGPGPLIDTAFQARFLMLTREQGGHRLSLRYDQFRVGDGAQPVEDGHGWTLAYRYRATPRLTVGAEWMHIYSAHPSWIRDGYPASADERQLQLRASFRWGTTGR